MPTEADPGALPPHTEGMNCIVTSLPPGQLRTRSRAEGIVHNQGRIIAQDLAQDVIQYILGVFRSIGSPFSPKDLGEPELSPIVSITQYDHSCPSMFQ